MSLYGSLRRDAAEIKEGHPGVLAELLHIVQHLRGGAVAFVRVCGHCMHGNLFDPAGNSLRNLSGQRRAAVDVLNCHGHRRFTVVGRTARQHLIHDDAERIKVGAVIHMRALRLLR